jgi:ubiquitin-conjugating enzyme E2 variant
MRINDMQKLIYLNVFKNMSTPPTTLDAAAAAKSFMASDEKNIKKEILKASYTPLKRASDITWTFVSLGLFIPSLYNIYFHLRSDNVWIACLAFFVAMLLADFFSGLVHWGADTWGNFDTPFFGKTFIRSFREHHIAPMAMTLHDIFETNGDNCLLTVPVLFMLMRKNCLSDAATGAVDPIAFFNLTTWTWVCLWVAITNQIHSWSHMLNPPTFVKVLQTTGLILGPAAHRKHHQIPFDRNYCITNGLAEYPLALVDFWRRAERFVHNTTGMIPREDDYKWTGISNDVPDVVKRMMASSKGGN